MLSRAFSNHPVAKVLRWTLRSIAIQLAQTLGQCSLRTHLAMAETYS